MSHIVFHNKFNRDWMRAFPLGNGRIGAMLYGDPNLETLEINEESLWSGKKLEESFSTNKENLNKIRELLFLEKYDEAEELSSKTLLAYPPRVRFYESFGELKINYLDKADYTNYKKTLNLENAIASVSYTKSGVKYDSEVFISEKYDCLVYKMITTGGSFSCNVSYTRGKDVVSLKSTNDTILLDGQVFCPKSDKHGDAF